ncbi:MAG TPA: winged helix-turn-helix domain-containing protein [Nitrososphaera sp.]|jgi:predicted transcriptional regulator|nr:winged helix-turn-helix domain-containing protein [Nitrososphaera sp.]
MKTSYRNKIMIIGDVLRVAEESGNGINHTSLLRKTNLSHATLCKIIANLVSAGVISEQLARRQHVYSITIKGKDYLDRYRQFAGVSDAFGLQL